MNGGEFENNDSNATGIDEVKDVENENRCIVPENSFDNDDSAKTSNIRIQVKVLNRKESSIDTNYEDYIANFDTEKYALQSKASGKEENISDEEDDTFNANMNQQETHDSHIVLPMEGDDLNGISCEDEQNTLNANGAEVWYGYGRNIYFQPMTCTTLPCIRTKSKQNKPRMLDQWKSGNGNMARDPSLTYFRLDIPTISNALNDVGTLRIAEGNIPKKRSSKEISSVSADGPRGVGNYAMSEGLKTKLCKGVACRTIKNSFVTRRTVSHQGSSSSDLSTDVRADVRPSRLGSRKHLYEKKMKKTREHFEKSHFSPRSIESQELFSFLPKMSQASNFIDKTPRKKVVAGKPLYLATSSQTIHKVNIFPFSKPSVYEQKYMKRFDSPRRVLNPSPTTDEEKIVNHLEEKVVADHLQEMKKREKFEPKITGRGSTEEQYAYDRLFSYYNDKLREGFARNGSLKGAIMTRSLISSQQNSRDSFSKPLGLENGLNYGTDKNNTTPETDAESCGSIIVSGRELALSGKNSSLNNIQTIDKMSQKGEERKRERSEERDKGELSYIETDKKFVSPLVDSETISSPYGQDNTIYEAVEESISSVDAENYTSKVVHFDDEESRVWFNDITATEPFTTTAVRPVDRYKIPSSNACRLPIIGQKITTDTS